MEFDYITLTDLFKRIRNEHSALDAKILDQVYDEMRALWQWGIERIRNESIRSAVKHYYMRIVPEQFFITPSSGSGMHHPAWHNRPAGIVRHLTECCVKADRKLQQYGCVIRYKDKDGKIRETVDPNMRDKVLAATVLTDTFKCGSPWGEKTMPNHGEIAASRWILLTSELIREAEEIAEAVHWHYGRYTPVPDGQPRKEYKDLPPLVQIVHSLDMDSLDYCNELIYRPVLRIPSPDSVRP